MPTFQVAFNKATKVATVQANGDALPNGSVKAGTFVHEGEGDLLDPGVNHVLYQHVRDVLYKASAANPNQAAMFPNNITDMGSIKITLDADYVALASIEIGANQTLTVASPTHQIVVTPTPGNASNVAVTYVSGTPAVATVSATGLVTRVSNGTSVITVTSQDGNRTDTKTITCTA